MVDYVLKKMLGTKNERELKKLRPMVARVNELEPRMKALAPEDFPRLVGEWKAQVQEKKRPLDELLPEAFALVREAGVRRCQTGPNRAKLLPFDFVWRGVT